MPQRFQKTATRNFFAVVRVLNFFGRGEERCRYFIDWRFVSGSYVGAKVLSPVTKLSQRYTPFFLIYLLQLLYMSLVCLFMSAVTNLGTQQAQIFEYPISFIMYPLRCVHIEARTRLREQSHIYWREWCDPLIYKSLLLQRSPTFLNVVCSTYQFLCP